MTIVVNAGRTHPLKRNQVTQRGNLARASLPQVFNSNE
jgi:hypothetical protein